MLRRAVLLACCLWGMSGPGIPAEPPGKSACVLYSGTFDPPHLGHLGVLRLAMSQTRADCAYVILNQSSRYKPDMLPYRTRQAMASLVFGQDPGVVVGDPAVDQAFTSFDLKPVLAVLRQRHPGARFYAVMGDDVLSRGLVDFIVDPDITYVVVFRTNFEVTLPSAPVRSLLIYPRELQVCSSSRIRAAVAQRQLTVPCASPPLVDFIRRERLYVTP